MMRMKKNRKSCLNVNEVNVDEMNVDVITDEKKTNLYER